MGDPSLIPNPDSSTITLTQVLADTWVMGSLASSAHPSLLYALCLASSPPIPPPYPPSPAPHPRYGAPLVVLGILAWGLAEHTSSDDQLAEQRTERPSHCVVTPVTTAGVAPLVAPGTSSSCSCTSGAAPTANAANAPAGTAGSGAGGRGAHDTHRTDYA